MDKKKISGLIVFTIFIGLILSYPSLKEGIEESILKRKVESAFKIEDFETVQELLSGRRLDRYAWDYIPYIVSKARLGNSIKVEIQSLIRDNQISILQYLLDNLGEITYQYVELLIPVRGLVLDEDSRYEVANELIKGIRMWEPGYAVMIDEAMHIRGERGIPDNIEVGFYSFYGNLEKAVELYKDLDIKYKQDAKEGLVDSLILHVLHGSSGVAIIVIEEAEILNWFEGLDLPDDLLLSFYKEVALRYTGSDYNVESLLTLAGGPYFNYYSSLGQLNRFDVNPKIVQKVLQELMSNDEYREFEGYEDVVRTLENYEMVNGLKGIGSNGAILYMDIDNKKVAYKSHDDMKELDVPGVLEIMAYSTDRQYYLASGFNFDESTAKVEFTDLLLDGDFNILVKSEITTSFQPNDEKWIAEVSRYASQTEFYPTHQQANFQREYGGVVRYGEAVEPIIATNFLIYSIAQDMYSIIEYTQNSLGYNRKATYYTEYDIETNDVLYQFDLRKEDRFLGSCKEKIYVARVIDDVLFVIESIDKNSSERTTLPLYFMVNSQRASGLYHLW